MTTIEQWWQAGDQVELLIDGSERHVFVRRFRNAAPHMTLLHGFPSSSHDWHKVAPALAERYELLLPDFLGFGASDKPPEHEYSIHEQADIVEELWEIEGVTETTVVAHDYAVSVAQELLARRAGRELTTVIETVHLLNGGLYPDVHRPQPVQEALLDPEQGPQISALMNEELMIGALKPIFAPDYDALADSVAIWRSMYRDDGFKNLYLLIRYMTDRRAHADRWVEALERTDVSLNFIWGMLDPVSGAHMAERIQQRLPSAPIAELQDVGHWPQLEAPDRVTAAILNP